MISTNKVVKKKNKWTYRLIPPLPHRYPQTKFCHRHSPSKFEKKITYVLGLYHLEKKIFTLYTISYIG